jgi:hypothetical protein
LWFWKAEVLVLRCDSCGKKMCSFDSGKPKTQGKIFVENKYFGGLDIGGLNYIFAI